MLSIQAKMMRKVVINQCYCDAFDISRTAKEMLRADFGIIFDPNYTSRDDPALVQVIEHLGEAAAIYHEEDCGRVYLSRPIIAYIPEHAMFEVISYHGYESIRLHESHKRRRTNEDENIHITKKMNVSK